MVKRESTDESDWSIKSDPDPDTAPTGIRNLTPSIPASGSESKKRKAKSSESISQSKSSKAKDPKTSKTRWSSEEDDLLIEMMERVLKEHIWAQARSEPLLASRTSYGVQYHALMLLRQGTGKAPSPSKGSKRSK